MSRLPFCERDWLIVAGDVGESPERLRSTLEVLSVRFARLVWVPGNHDLWTSRDAAGRLGTVGEARYLELVEICRSFGVLTPEDPYARFVSRSGPVIVVPLFTLYDYSFRSPGLSKGAALAAAERAGVVCSDEFLLHPDPYPTREAWCHARVAETVARLDALPSDARTVLVSHFPLRSDVVALRWIPQFELWCGTRLTEDWHRRYRAVAVVYGHLHRPGTTWRDGVRFEEVSFGYPREQRWRAEQGIVLRDVLPER